MWKSNMQAIQLRLILTADLLGVNKHLVYNKLRHFAIGCPVAKHAIQ